MEPVVRIDTYEAVEKLGHTVEFFPFVALLHVPALQALKAAWLPVEEQTRWVGSERGEAAPAAGGGEPAAEAHRGRTGGGHPGVEGGGRKKVVSPQMPREAVLVTQVEVGLSGLMEIHHPWRRTRCGRWSS